MKLKLHRGSTHKLIHVFIQDTTKTDGSGLAGLTSASSGLTCYYFREGDTSATAISLAAGTLGTWSSGGFVAVDGTNLPGFYELGLPDAAISTGNSVKMLLKGATNMVACPVEIELDAADYQDSQRLGLAALPSTGTLAVKPAVTLAAADVTGNLPANVNQWLAATPNSLQSGRVDAYAGASAASLTFNLTGNLSGSVGSVAGDVGGKILGGGSGTITGAGAWALDSLGNTVVSELVRQGLAQSGSSGDITLDAGASASNTSYSNARIQLVAGTGAGQFNIITGYNGSTKLATVASNWLVNPDATTRFAIFSDIAPPGGWPNNFNKTAITSAGTVTAGTVQDKIGYFLSSSQSFNNISQTSNLPANVQQWASHGVSVDANNLPSVNAADWNGTTITTGQPNSGNVTVGGYATGQDPGTYVLVTPANKIAANASNQVVASSVQGNVSGNVVGSVGSVTSSVTVGGYSTGQDPATLLLVTPANKIVTNSQGKVSASDVIAAVSATVVAYAAGQDPGTLILAKSLTPRNQDSVTAPTVGDAMQGAWEEAFGKESIVGTSLTKKLPDNSAASRTFVLDSGTSPTSRT